MRATPERAASCSCRPTIRACSCSSKWTREPACQVCLSRSLLVGARRRSNSAHVVRSRRPRRQRRLRRTVGVALLLVWPWPFAVALTLLRSAGRGGSGGSGGRGGSGGPSRTNADGSMTSSGSSGSHGRSGSSGRACATDCIFSCRSSQMHAIYIFALQALATRAAMACAAPTAKMARRRPAARSPF